jgi:hypothetical protein
MDSRYIFPAFAMTMLSLAVGVLMLYRRYRALMSKEIKWSRFKTLSLPDAPDDVLKAERHFINLFELPVLFYTASLIAIFMPLKNQYGICVAWSFVLFRLIQAGIHLWPNKILYRMTAYLLGFATVLIFWLMIVCQAAS